MRIMSKTLQLAAAAGILAMSGLLAASPTQAATTDHTVSAALQHYIDCANWLVSDPAKHAEECGPGHTVFVSGSTGTGAPCDPCDWCCKIAYGLVKRPSGLHFLHFSG